MSSGADVYELRLKWGRVLKGWPLSLVCAARNLLLAAPLLIFEDGDVIDWLVAPSWVIVTERGTGEQVAKVAAGRGADSGRALLDLMTERSTAMSSIEFLDFARRGARVPRRAPS